MKLNGQHLLLALHPAELYRVATDDCGGTPPLWRASKGGEGWGSIGGFVALVLAYDRVWVERGWSEIYLWTGCPRWVNDKVFDEGLTRELVAQLTNAKDGKTLGHLVLLDIAGREVWNSKNVEER